jgi:MoaA/NifB/PqqE/SkfB family radical SAM enzyme
MNSNQARIFEWYDFLKNELKPDKMNVNYIRPPSARPEELNIDKARYDALTHQIAQDSRHAAIKNRYSGDAGFFKAAIDIYMHELIARTAFEGRPQLQCWAGTAGAVVYDEGTVSSCEILPAVSNLRAYDWNFSKLWYSPAMDGRRETVANGCFCTHESNCYYPSLAFNPGHLVQIKRLEREIKEAAELVHN